ncbi:interaptin-like [Impatiens glandulifera]|uniref:interaptin-like n=1 Tax=Impatiens glandulifera TaxID=253017 RepID=UPI001FB0C0B8|nr:interaptin-like [Impatiens glandulifera]
MSRITNWKLEKAKVKVVFRLQFHASHIPQTGWDKLFISFFPAESVKLTAKTTKAIVRNGTCKWADPIYETTRLLQDSKTKEFDDKLYKFVVAMGSSRASILGEASINLADYADALKPSVVPLPLHGCNSGAILHVTVQLLTSKTGFREFEQQREQREKGFSTGTDQNKNGESGSGNMLSPEVLSNDQVDIKVKLRSRSKDLPPLEEETQSTGEYSDFAVGFEGSSNTSESLCAEKNETCSTHEIESLKSTASGDLSGFTQCQSPQADRVNPTDHQIPVKGRNDWIHGWGSEGSIDNDLVLVHEENARLRGNLEVAENSILELKMQVSSLQVYAHEIGAETQNFAKQLSAEVVSGEELALEASAMKSECAKLKEDIEFLRSIKSAPQLHSMETSAIDDHVCLVREMQIKWLERLLFMEGKVQELHNKAYLGFQERDIRFLTSDLESLLVTIQELRQGNGETISLLNNLFSGKSRTKENTGGEQFVLGNGFNVDLYQPADMLHCLNMPSLKSQEPDSAVATSMLKDKIFELLKEADDAKAEREALTRKMEQMESYYEALIHDLEENQKQMLGELQSLTDEHSACLFNIASTKAEMESIRQDMNGQILQLAEEKHDLDAMNKEIEKRAVTSEAALRRARLNYSIAVDQLQKDLDLLSSQVLSMFETNENLIKQTYSGSDVIESFQPQNQNIGLKKQLLGGDILVDDMKKSLLLQEELYQKVEGELCEMHSMNVHLDVFSKILQQTLVEANAEIMTMGGKTDQLSHELSLSTEGNKSLMLKLQAALDDIETLNECKITNSLQNRLLEDKLENLSYDNACLSQKVIEFKSTIQKYTDMESRYEACSADNTKLTDLLKQESSKNEILQNNVFALTEGLKIVKAEYDEVISSGEIVQESTRLSEEKLRNLLASHSGEFSKYVHDLERFDMMSIIEQLEILLSVSGEKSIQLLGEKKLIEEERDIAQASMGAIGSEIISLKQKFNHDVNQMGTKIVASSALLEKLQLQLDVFANRLQISCDAEETYTNQNRELYANLSVFEAEITQLASKNSELAKEIMALESVNEQVGYSNSTISRLTQENQQLVVSSREKDEKCVFLQDEVQVERNLRINVEETVLGLTSQLNEKNDQLLDYEQLKAELAQLRMDIDVERNLRNNIEETVSDLTCQLNEKNGQLLGYEQLKAELAQIRMEIEVERNLRHNIEETVSDLTSQLNEKNDRLLDYEQLKTELAQLRMDIEVERNLRNNIEETVSDLTCQLNEKNGQLLGYEQLKAEFVQLRMDTEVERNLRDNIEETVSKLTCQLNEKNDRLLDYEKLKAELVQLRLDIEVEKSRVRSFDQLHEKSSGLIGMGSQLSDMHEYAMVLDVKSVFLRSQYEDRFNELSLHTGELQNKNLHLEMMINNCMASQEHYVEENARLVNAMESLRSELKFSMDKYQAASDLNRVLEIELGEYKKRISELQAIELEVRRMKSEIISAEEENDHLIASMEESEIFVIVLTAGLNELNARVISLEGYKDKTMKLQNQYDELNKQLTEQTRKAEEFKNLSTRLKELKDEAEAECYRAREKRESEGQSDSIQESLRIAFMKEQCETIVQELRQELFMSKKHGEEMLLKLQDAVDEIENRKKFEASHSKRNEELTQKVLELEEELQSAVSHKREKNKAYDSVNTELECALLSIEYCKEEKEGLKTSLQECMEENSRISNELTLTNGKLESVTSLTCDCKRHSGSNGVRRMPTHHTDMEEDEKLGSSKEESAGIYSVGSYSSRNLDDVDSASTKAEKDAQSPSIRSESWSTPLKKHIIQDVTTEIPLEPEKGTSPHEDLMHLALINDTFKNQSLKSSMDNLHKELERMKSDNLFLKSECELDPDIAYLQKEVAQLDEVNEQLKCKFPTFIECQSNGNALERVLALEIELAESLQSKQKSTVQFQSSFIKQHNDEQAVLQSFRDINELIKEMLDMKGRYSSVENELKDMHDRYSQLSLQFAEVEGERQKLTMMLKNTRTSKKQLLSPSRSSSITLANSPS